MSSICQRLQSNTTAALGWVTTKGIGNAAWAAGKTAGCVLGVISLENVEELARKVWDGMPDLVDIDVFGYDVTDAQLAYLPDHAVTYAAVAITAAFAAKAISKAGNTFCKSCCSMASKQVKKIE